MIRGKGAGEGEMRALWQLGEKKRGVSSFAARVFERNPAGDGHMSPPCGDGRAAALVTLNERHAPSRCTGAGTRTWLW